jgi:hypothetical protein
LTCKVSAYGEVLPKNFTLHSEVEAPSMKVSLSIWSFGEQYAVEHADSISIQIHSESKPLEERPKGNATFGIQFALTAFSVARTVPRMVPEFAPSVHNRRIPAGKTRNP